MTSKGWDKGTTYCKRLRINSANRVNLTQETDTNFTVNLGPNTQQIIKVSVVSCQFTNAFYNIFSTSRKYNNYIEFVITGTGAGTYQISVPPGRYSVSTLLTAIQTAITADPTLGTTVGLVLTMSLNPTTNLVSLYGTTTSGSGVTIQAPTTPPIGVTTRQDYWPFGILGFNSSFVMPTSAPTALVATYFPHLNNPSIVYITSSALAPTNSFDEEGKTSNILLPVDITVPFLGLQTFECKVDGLYEINFGSRRPLSIIDIQLVDHDLDPLDLHQTEFNLELRVWTNNF